MEKQSAAGLEAQGSRPRSYTDEYRRQVVDMVASTGRTAMSVASELGIHHTLISRWIRRYGRPGSASPAAPARPAAAALLKPVPVLHADQAAEIARLKRENERLRMERDILKKLPRSCAPPVGVETGGARVAAGGERPIPFWWHDPVKKRGPWAVRVLGSGDALCGDPG